MTQPPVYRFTVSYSLPDDPASRAYLADAHSLGLAQVQSIACADLFFIQGDLNPAQLELAARNLFGDPVVQRVHWERADQACLSVEPGAFHLEVAYHPGVTDPVASQIVRAAHELGINAVTAAATGRLFLLSGSGLTETDVRLLARRLLANPVIQRYELGFIQPSFSQPISSSGKVEEIPLGSMSDDQLDACSIDRRAALDRAEMRAIREYFRGENRPCSDVEFEMIAQTWSEHCVHKTFKALIDIEPASGTPYPPQVNGILKTYIKKATDEIVAPWVISAFTDNAGVIAFDDRHEVSFKVETHNHPSAIEPFGGANTGVGGVIRDVIGVSARPVAATDILCFGPLDSSLDDLPEGVYHPRRIYSGVVAGVQDYGNKIGIPTVNGAIWFDPGYTANPLVYCGCLGFAPRRYGAHAPQPGDRVIVLGGRTGRDGLRGATFSSMTMDAQTGEVAGASVQIGDPITEKGTIEVILRARDQGLYNAITDCGAGGFSSAIGEMASEIGADVDLALAPLKYPGLAPWEIWLSESQERMVIAVPTENIPVLRELSALFDVEMTDLGCFTGAGRMVVRYNEQVVANLDNRFLHDGIPQRRLKASIPLPSSAAPIAARLPHPSEALLSLLAHPNIASKEAVVRIYDHEVQGATCVKPLTGARSGPADACVLKPPDVPGSTAIVISNGFNPEYGKVDPYRMALCVIDEAVRNAVAVGADPDYLAVLDNFCWGDPLQPEIMGSLLEAARGCYDGAVANRTPFISGKDSFNNEYLSRDGRRQSIPPSLLISAVGIIPDVSRVVTLDLKKAGDPVYLVGDFLPSFGGSHFSMCYGIPVGAPAEAPHPSARTPSLYRSFYRAVGAGMVRACHDLSEGGLAVAAAEMAISSGLGMNITLPADSEALRALFAETAGCLLVEVSSSSEAQWLHAMAGSSVRRIGSVNQTPRLVIDHSGQNLLSLTVQELDRAWRTPLL